MKKNFVSDLKFGTALRGEQFCVKEVSGSGCFTLSDRTGSVEAVLVEASAEKMDLLKKSIGLVVKITGPVLKKPESEGIILQVKVKEFSLAEKGTYLVNEVFGGITEEAKKELISRIDAWVGHLAGEPQLKALVDALLTKDVLEKLALYPATHDDYGSYVGGALVATAAVTCMCAQAANMYVRCGNGVSTQPPNYHLLVAAALIHQVGRIVYLDEADPFKKSEVGVVLNYYATLQDYITGVVAEKHISIDKMEYAKLLNILQVAVSDRCDTRSVTKEARILRSSVRLFGELDVVDWCAQNHQFEEGESFYYEPRCNSYIFAPPTKLKTSEAANEPSKEVSKCS